MDFKSFFEQFDWTTNKSSAHCIQTYFNPFLIPILLNENKRNHEQRHHFERSIYIIWYVQTSECETRESISHCIEVGKRIQSIVWWRQISEHTIGSFSELSITSKEKCTHIFSPWLVGLAGGKKTKKTRTTQIGCNAIGFIPFRPNSQQKNKFGIKSGGFSSHRANLKKKTTYNLDTTHRSLRVFCFLMMLIFC